MPGQMGAGSQRIQNLAATAPESGGLLGELAPIYIYALCISIIAVSGTGPRKCMSIAASSVDE